MFRPFSHFILCTFVTGSALVLSSAVATADEAPATEVRVTSDSKTPPSPRTLRINTMLETHRETLAELTRQFHQAANQLQAEQIEHQIRLHKHDMNLALIELRIEWALEDGHDEAARALQKRVDSLREDRTEVEAQRPRAH